MDIRAVSLSFDMGGYQERLEGERKIKAVVEIRNQNQGRTQGYLNLLLYMEGKVHADAEIRSRGCL